MKHTPRRPRDDVNISQVHPLRELFALVLGVGLGALVLVVLVGEAIDRLVPRIPPAWERTIFPHFLVPDVEESVEPRRRARIERLLARMASHWPENPYELELGIVDREQPNAFALPGGTILVTTGLLDDAGSENEVAFILGHELGHFRNRDHLRGLSRGLVLSMIVSSLLDEGAVDFLSVAEGFALRSYSREQESDADRFGLELLHDEYGHVAGATDFFARLPKPEGRIQRRAVAYVSTHPLGEHRVWAIQQTALERGWSLKGRKRPLRTPKQRPDPAG